MKIIIDENVSCELIHEGDADKINRRAYGKINIDNGRAYSYVYAFHIIDITNKRKNMTRDIANSIFKENRLREQLLNILTEQITKDFNSENETPEYTCRNDVSLTSEIYNCVISKKLAICIKVSADKTLEDIISLINRISEQLIVEYN